jgi:hypothetical protein
VVLAVGGMPWAFEAVIAISAVHLLFFLVQEKSLGSFPTQIRIVYLLVTLFGLWSAVRVPIYIVLLLGTVMVTFFGRCANALVLEQMLWNRGRELRLN